MTVVLPSAIYDPCLGGNTNVARLIKYSKALPLFPIIPIKKSLTEMEKFCDFLVYSLSEADGLHCIAIERPVETVGQIVKRHFPQKKQFKVYGIESFLLFVSGVIEFILPNLGITRARIRKLFKSTDYENVNVKLDVNTYNFFIRESTR